MSQARIFVLDGLPKQIVMYVKFRFDGTILFQLAIIYLVKNSHVKVEKFINLVSQSSILGKYLRVFNLSPRNIVIKL